MQRDLDDNPEQRCSVKIRSLRLITKPDGGYELQPVSASSSERCISRAAAKVFFAEAWFTFERPLATEDDPDDEDLDQEAEVDSGSMSEKMGHSCLHTTLGLFSYSAGY